MSSTNKNIVYGDKDILPDVPFNPKDVKIRISIMIDGDILQAYKQEAAQLQNDLLSRVSFLEKKMKIPPRKRGKKSRSAA